ncbi:CLUMA_CG004954, isoform A [Clunio marinus]|uniref:CLUMA_CG004954, isoform A n=1 Tax=Clunio marinus TaxID=568069 RepID=A0A1J1HTF5_9DIPT|nr:CLUMA_CG004954, isoform A [Clunio marinus]
MNSSKDKEIFKGLFIVKNLPPKALKAQFSQLLYKHQSRNLRLETVSRIITFCFHMTTFRCRLCSYWKENLEE